MKIWASSQKSNKFFDGKSEQKIREKQELGASFQLETLRENHIELSTNNAVQRPRIGPNKSQERELTDTKICRIWQKEAGIKKQTLN